MEIRKRDWLELALFLAISATITIIGFVQTKNIAWRILSLPVGILFGVCIAYWAPNSVIKIKKAKPNKRIRGRVAEAVAEIRLRRRPL
ncbi:MAG: hypothetical protein PHW01_01475 [Patescibacteria group bacterium]|nr:hypothetical protein [Patescibacteria group bacterium]